MVHESEKGSYTYTGGRDSDGFGGQWWIFAIVVVFFAMMFWKKDDRGKRDDNGILEGVALSGGLGGFAGARHGGNHCIDEKVWDTDRDVLNGFGKQNENFWRLSSENANNFSNQRFETAMGFKNSEILGLQNNKEVLTAIATLNQRLDQDIIRKQGEDLTTIRTILGVRGYGHVPAAPMQQANIMQQHVNADMGGGYGYGW